MGPEGTSTCLNCGTLTLCESGGYCSTCLRKGIQALKELEKLKTALRQKIDHDTWFYKNCKRQRKAEAKICQVCPFRVLIEATE